MPNRTITKIEIAFYLARSPGLVWLARRLWFAVEKKSGLLRRRTPAIPLDALHPFPCEADSFAADWRIRAPRLPIAGLDPELARPFVSRSAAGPSSPQVEAAAIRQGRFPLFSGRHAELGFPPNWHLNPLTGQSLPARPHWSLLGDFDYGDIKGVWETSRFSWAFTLVRAWLADGDPLHAETFWRLVEDWTARNPPNRGPNWKCGQEAAIRLFALSFAVHAFARTDPTTANRLALAARLVHATARRIDAHLAYSLSQSNNHGISEAAGLITAGALWPMLPGAEHWLAKGLDCLENQVRELVYSDGGFSQHSTNYHRLLLGVLVWCDVVLRAAGRSLPVAIQERASKATLFLAALMEADGGVHRYGADDGAVLFPLSSSDYSDFRPAVGAALVAFCNTRLPPGPWDETALLLSGQRPAPFPLLAPGSRLPADFPAAGVRLIRFERGSALFRVPTHFRHRPSHADQLHMDLWLDGAPVSEDPGTFSYNAPGPLGGGMTQALFHNTVTVGGSDPMIRASRFLWLPWTPCHRWPDRENLIQAWHDGYRRLPSRFRHARAVLVARGGLVVVDRLTGEKEDDLVLRWHGRSRSGLAGLQVLCSSPSTEEWITANDETGEGWRSPHYAERTAAWCRRISTRAKLAFFVTSFGIAVRFTKGQLWLGERSMPLSPHAEDPILAE